MLREDGGTVCLDIAQSDRFTETSPLVFFLPTISGSSETTNGFVRYAIKRGWRAIVLNRRGHSHPLTSPRFNLMGDTDDTVAMIRHGKRLFPKASFYGAVGISAGSGQLVSYIGGQGKQVDISAAVSLCPAYNMENAFDNLDRKHPKISNLLLKRLQNYFLINNAEILSDNPAFDKSLQASNMQDFLQAVSPFAGVNDWQDYLIHHNPMQHYQGNKIPCLILNSMDDPVCVKENIPDITVTNYALIITRYGSHVAFSEKWTGMSSWMERLAMDFLDSCRSISSP